MFRKILRIIKNYLARFFARMFYRIVDPEVEFELASTEEYTRMQQHRQREVEGYLSRYLGPRA